MSCQIADWCLESFQLSLTWSHLVTHLSLLFLHSWLMELSEPLLLPFKSSEKRSLVTSFYLIPSDHRQSVRCNFFCSLILVCWIWLLGASSFWGSSYIYKNSYFLESSLLQSLPSVEKMSTPHSQWQPIPCTAQPFHSCSPSTLLNDLQRVMVHTGLYLK